MLMIILARLVGRSWYLVVYSCSHSILALSLGQSHKNLLSNQATRVGQTTGTHDSKMVLPQFFKKYVRKKKQKTVWKTS